MKPVTAVTAAAPSPSLLLHPTIEGLGGDSNSNNNKYYLHCGTGEAESGEGATGGVSVSGSHEPVPLAKVLEGGYVLHRLKAMGGGEEYVCFLPPSFLFFL